MNNSPHHNTIVQEKATLNPRQQCILIIIGIALILSLIVFIYWVFFQIITFVVPKLIGILVIIYSIYFLLYSLTKTIVFPGSLTIQKRKMEQMFGIDIAKRSEQRFKKLQIIINHLKNNQENGERFSQKNASLFASQEDIGYSQDDVMYIRNSIQLLVTSYEGLKNAQKLSKNQQIFFQILEDFDKLMQETEIKWHNLQQFEENENQDYSQKSDDLQEEGKINQLNQFSRHQNDELYYIKNQMREIKNLGQNTNFKQLIEEKYDIFSNDLFDQIAYIDSDKATQISHKIDCLIAIFQEIKRKKITFKEKWNDLFFQDTLGTLDQLRQELILNLKGQRFFLKTKDKKKIDCMFIPCPEDLTHKKRLQYMEDQISPELIQRYKEDEQGPTVIYCNPNAGYYECLYYDSEWVEFYQKMGMNIILWNYRGYGRSEGNPTPESIKKDSELLVDYARNELNIKNIAVHGQSLGGMFATNMARKKNLQFLLADRTFGILSDVATYGLGRVFKILFKLLVNWDIQSGKNFAKTDCFKIIAFDPKDEVIPYLASLKSNVSRYKISAQKLQHIPFIQSSNDHYDQQDIGEDLQYRDQNQSIIFTLRKKYNLQVRSFSLYCKQTWRKDQILREGAKLLLNDREIIQLHYALQRITDIIKEVINQKDKEENANFQELYKGSKPQKIKQNLQNIAILNDKEELEERRYQFYNLTNSLTIPTNQENNDEISTIYSSNAENQSQFLSQQKPNSNNNIQQQIEQVNSQINSQNNSNCKTPSISEIGPASFRESVLQQANSGSKLEMSPDQIQSLNMTLEDFITSVTDRRNSDENLLGLDNVKNEVKLQEQKNIVDMIPESLKKSEDFQYLCINIYQILDYFEAGGVSMADIFTLFQGQNTIFLLEQYLINLQVYGSNQPWKIIKNNLNDPKQYKRLAYSKLRNGLKQLNLILEEQKKNPQSFQDPIKSQIIDDLQIIKKNITIIYSKMDYTDLEQSFINNNLPHNSHNKDLAKDFSYVAQYNNKERGSLENSKQSIQKKQKKSKEIELTDLTKNLKDSDNQMPQDKLYNNADIENQNNETKNSEFNNKIINTNRDSNNININKINNNSDQIQINVDEANNNNQNLQIQPQHLMILTCGHNGIYSRAENFAYEKFLRASGIIPDYDKLGQIYQKKIIQKEFKQNQEGDDKL